MVSQETSSLVHGFVLTLAKDAVGSDAGVEGRLFGVTGYSMLCSSSWYHQGGLVTVVFSNHPAQM